MGDDQGPTECSVPAAKGIKRYFSNDEVFDQTPSLHSYLAFL